MGDLSQVPPDFLTALGALRRAACRAELKLEEIPAPTRLAPYAVSLGAEVLAPGPVGPGSLHGPAAPPVPDQLELATGRFILLHDPAGSPVWNGTFRIVTYIRAELEPDMGNDQLLGSVAWTWLVEALEQHNARYSMAGGTATRVLSESYGTLERRDDSIDIELRASWTPADADVQSHLEAWSDMVCTFAGLPPLPDGVTPLPGRRRS
ncbi:MULTISPECIES: DUF3000 domain-containing protein [unclassified Arthrobacter]|uniref:DUF3000 domain-containing protein n=1 Tax=unclassified Arthrobacter TaxID=235627 RepID=UPI001D13763B|nr:DUF3000 domain-containing protein [Arthrobacter sp. zg-Y1110]MCC3290827.1 DUF3000 domain-containing protein [Arthrobacter sp. zg-Y1110]MCC3301784.1 DUF3000 domain-containing protein [Arthrobacter sp. zg-Y895]MCC9174961.1 DUF3000 domain-containing protein [Arthrobacter sp. zg-Y179]UWX86566.1 DUF3000 domain-containing protein [Arthrobacter sp. zg-Y1110]